MEWASENLDNNTFYSTADDDMMVNVCKLKQLMDEHIKKTSVNKWPEFPIICTFEIRKSSRPIRNVKHKNYLSEKDYKWPSFPDFCLGGMYTTSVNVARQLYKISRTRSLLNTDDVLITGIWRNILGMPNDMLIKTDLKVVEHMSNHFGKLSNKQFLNSVLNKWSGIFSQCSKLACKN